MFGRKSGWNPGPVIIQQDGTAPHYFLEVMHYLDTVFPGQWIGPKGSIKWPACSLDLPELFYNNIWNSLMDYIIK